MLLRCEILEPPMSQWVIRYRPIQRQCPTMSAPSPIATVPGVSPNCRDVPTAEIRRLFDHLVGAGIGWRNG